MTGAIQNIPAQFNQFGVFIEEGDLLFFDGVARRLGTEYKVGEGFGDVFGGMRGGVIIHELILMS